MHDDFYIDLFTEDEDTFDLERDYQVFVEGVKKDFKKALKHYGIKDLDSNSRDQLVSGGRFIKHNLVGFEDLADGNKDKSKQKKEFNKKTAKNYIKYQAARLAGNQSDIEKYGSKYEKNMKKYNDAKESNKKKIERRWDEYRSGEGWSNREQKVLNKDDLKDRLHKHIGKEREDKKVVQPTLSLNNKQADKIVAQYRQDTNKKKKIVRRAG